MIYILAFIVLIGVIVFVHELGHFWAARSVGVGVERFSVGMPPNFIDFTKTEKGLVVDIFFFGLQDKKIKWKKVFSTTFSSFNTPIRNNIYNWITAFRWVCKNERYLR